MFCKALVPIVCVILFASELLGAKIVWTDGTAGFVPGSSITYTITGNHDETSLITNTQTWDGDHTWDPSGTGYRKRGGDLTTTITFSSPIPINLLTAAALDLESGRDILTVSGGTADVGDLVLDPGLVDPAVSTDLVYNDTTGALTRTIREDRRHDGHLLGTSSDTVSSLTLATAEIREGDWVLHYVGFTGVVPEPSSISLAVGLGGILGIRRRRRALTAN